MSIPLIALAGSIVIVAFLVLWMMGGPGPAPVVGFGAVIGTPVIKVAGAVAFDIISNYLALFLSWQRCRTTNNRCFIACCF
jgi:hypothetical protein